MNRIYFQKLCPDAVIPSRATRQSAGFDLSLCGSEPVTVQPGETVMIHTGVAVVLPEGTAGMVLSPQRACFPSWAGTCQLCWRDRQRLSR